MLVPCVYLAIPCSDSCQAMTPAKKSEQMLLYTIVSYRNPNHGIPEDAYVVDEEL